MSPGMRALWPLALATCLSIVALGIVIPVLPFQLRALGAGEALTPVIFTVYSAAAFLSAPLWGRLSDRIGRKPVLLIAITASTLSYLWLAGADQMWEVFAARLFAGATSGWLAASQAFVADVTDRRGRARGMALLGIAFGIGFTIGPFTGALLVGLDPGFTLPALIAAGFTLAALVLTALALREPDRHAGEAGQEVLRVSYLRDPLMLRLMAVYFCMGFVFTAVEGVFAIWVERILALGAREVGFYLAYTGVVTILVQGAVGRLAGRFGELPLLAIGVGAFTLGLVSFPFVSGPWGVLLPMGLIALGVGLHNPTAQSLISRAAPDDRTGGALGTAQALASLARILGPTLGGLAFAGIAPDAPFWIGAVMLAPVLALVLGQRDRVRALAAAGR